MFPSAVLSFFCRQSDMMWHACGLLIQSAFDQYTASPIMLAPGLRNSTSCTLAVQYSLGLKDARCHAYQLCTYPLAWNSTLY